MYVVLDVQCSVIDVVEYWMYWICHVVDEMDVIFVVLRNSAANAAVAAIAAVFLKTVANCVEYICIRRNYRPKIQNSSYNCVELYFRRNLSQKIIFFL